MTVAAPQVSSRPWLSIWTHPRSTYRALLDAPPRGVEWLLIMTSGFAQSMVQGYQNNIGAKGSLLLIFTMSALVGSIWGLLQYHLITGLLYLVDKWTGGRATYRELRTATAWAALPQVVVVAAWILGAAAVGRALFIDAARFSLQPSLVQLLVFLVTFACCVWSVVILIAGLAEAQRGSIGKAILTVLGAGLLLMAAALVFVLLFVGAKAAVG